MLIVSCSKYLEDVKVIDSINYIDDNDVKVIDNDVKVIDSINCKEDNVDIFTNMMTAYLESWFMEDRSPCLDLFDSIYCEKMWDIFTNMMTANLEFWLMEDRNYCLDLSVDLLFR